MRSFIVLKEKTQEEVARCGSAKTAIKYAKRQREKYSVIQIIGGANGVKRIF